MLSIAKHSNSPEPPITPFWGEASKGSLPRTPWCADLVLGGGREQNCRGPRRLLGEKGSPHPLHPLVTTCLTDWNGSIRGPQQQWPWGPRRCQGSDSRGGVLVTARLWTVYQTKQLDCRGDSLSPTRGPTWAPGSRCSFSSNYMPSSCTRLRRKSSKWGGALTSSTSPHLCQALLQAPGTQH